MTIILGTFGSSSTPFCLYTYNSYHYFCLDEINTIYCKNNITKKASDIHQIFKAAPNDFIKNKKTGQIFVMTRTVPHIARLFNCYGLAELCKLSTDEILGRVAEPLLNNIQCDQWQHALSYHVLVERDLQFESLYGDEWIFVIAPPVSLSPTRKLEPRSCHVTSHHKSPLYRWLSSTLHNPSAQKAKRQQQAIIETRQRQQAFITPTSKSKKKIAGQLDQLPQSPPIKRKSSYPSSSSLPAATGAATSPPTTKVRAAHHTTAATAARAAHHTTTAAKPKRQKISHPPIIVMTTPTNNSHHAHETKDLIDHGNDNLNLLATQAMQLRGLPPSPLPEPTTTTTNTFRNQRLPSLQTMLSELNQHCVVQFGERRNMDSCA